MPAIDEACWDFQLFPAGKGAELEAMILAIKKDAVEEMVAASAKAGLVVDCVELAPTAIINAFRYNYPEIQTCTLILEIGARSTNIVLVEGDKVFCRIVPLGGASVTQAIASDLQESYAGAETLKIAKGFVHPGGSYEDPQDAIAARISKLSRGAITRLHTEVERSVTFYRSQQGGNRPAQVLLAGGGAELGLVDFFFREKLKIPVSYFQPFRRIELDGSALAEAQKNFPSWTCFVGTALRALADSPCRPNIIAHLKNESLGKAKDRPAMVAAGIAAGALMLLPGVHGYWQGGKVDSLISPQKDEVEMAEATVAQAQAIQKKVADQVALLETAANLEKERLRWPILLEELAKKSQPGMWITRISIQSDNAASKGQSPVGNSAPAAPQTTYVELSGIFETKTEEADAQVVDMFRKSLEEGGVLQKIVTVERETPERSADGKTEQVALKFTLRGEWPPSGGSALKQSEKTKAP